MCLLISFTAFNPLMRIMYMHMLSGCRAEQFHAHKSLIYFLHISMTRATTTTTENLFSLSGSPMYSLYALCSILCQVFRKSSLSKTVFCKIRAFHIFSSCVSFRSFVPLLTLVSQNHISSLEHLKTFVSHVQTTSEKLLFCSYASRYHFKSSGKTSFCDRQEYYSSLQILDVQTGKSGRGKDQVIGVLWTCSHVNVFTLDEFLVVIVYSVFFLLYVSFFKLIEWDRCSFYN